jgi:hypothetical protein
MLSASGFRIASPARRPLPALVFVEEALDQTTGFMDALLGKPHTFCAAGKPIAYY